MSILDEAVNVVGYGGIGRLSEQGQRQQGEDWLSELFIHMKI
jgi:hypothetical protein